MYKIERAAKIGKIMICVSIFYAAYTLEAYTQNLKTPKTHLGRRASTQKIKWHPYDCFLIRPLSQLHTQQECVRFVSQKVKDIQRVRHFHKPIQIIFYKDSIPTIFILPSGHLYLSSAMFLSLQHTGELVSILTHELIHYESGDFFWEVTIPEKVRKKMCCIDSMLHQKILETKLQSNEWKRKEQYVDSLTLSTLLALQYYPVSGVERLDKKQPFYAPYCNAFIPERIVYINRLWVSKGMPSYPAYQKEYTDLKNKLQ